MTRLLSLAYAGISYTAFLASFLYAIAFLGNLLVPEVVPKSIDSGATTGLAQSALINIGLLALFAIQHTIMARPAFKRWWTRIVPKQVERSTFVLVASLLLFLIFWQWRPMPAMVWSVEHPLGRIVLWTIFWIGWLVVLVSTFLISHFDLFGLRQVWLHFRGREYHHTKFQTKSLYKYVRHPIMLGFVIAFWATPDMSMGHLLFALVTTGYTILGIQIEERDLVDHIGETYEDYRRRVPALVPFTKRAPRG